MKVLLIFDEEFEINKKDICDFLNNNTVYLKFELGDDVRIDHYVLSKPASFDFVANQLQNPFENFDRVFCFTDKLYDDNYFLHENNLLSIFTFWGWPHLTNLPHSNGLIYFIIYYFALVVDKSDFRHHESTGCIYDFLWSKDGIDDGMRQAKICPTCLERVTKNISTEEQIQLLEDLKILMNLLSNASKWNQDIMESKALKIDPIRKRKSKISGEINIVIASPGDTQTERKHLLEKLEIQFRRGNHEQHCSKRLIVHGWEDLASQPGYAQDVINKKLIQEMDFVVAVFKHKLGTPTIDIATGKVRAESGTTEELLQALDNTSIVKPLGMAYFYSKAPKISLDTPELESIKTNWDQLEAFKKSIRNKLIYKPYNKPTDLLQMVITDLEKNIIDNFE